MGYYGAPPSTAVLALPAGLTLGNHAITAVIAGGAYAGAAVLNQPVQKQTAGVAQPTYESSDDGDGDLDDMGAETQLSTNVVTSEGNPTGMVTFLDGVSGDVLDVAAIAADGTVLAADGATAALSAGMHVIVAVYSGDAVFAVAANTVNVLLAAAVPAGPADIITKDGTPWKGKTYDLQLGETTALKFEVRTGTSYQVEDGPVVADAIEFRAIDDRPGDYTTNYLSNFVKQVHWLQFVKVDFLDKDGNPVPQKDPNTLNCFVANCIGADGKSTFRYLPAGQWCLDIDAADGKAMDQGPVAAPSKGKDGYVYRSVFDKPVPNNAMKIDCASIRLSFQTYCVYTPKDPQKNAVLAEVDWTCTAGGDGSKAVIQVNAVKQGNDITLLPNLSADTLYTGKDGGTTAADDFPRPKNPVPK